MMKSKNPVVVKWEPDAFIRLNVTRFVEEFVSCVDYDIGKQLDPNCNEGSPEDAAEFRARLEFECCELLRLCSEEI